MNWKRTVWVVVWLGKLTMGHGDEVVDLRPLVVEGRHFDEVAMELPLGVKRLERDEIGRSGARGVPELLERLGGVRFIDTTGNGTTGQVALRGFGDNSGQRVLIIVDGQVYNPPDMGGINWDGIDLEDLETVEILRGGQTVLYGNHAVAGVIKLTGGAIRDGMASRFMLGAGSDGAAWATFGASMRKGGAGIRAAASRRESDGFREHSSLVTSTGGLSWTLGTTGRAGWKGRVHYSNSEMELPGPLTYEQMLEDPRQAIEGVDDRVSNEGLQFTHYGEGRTSWGSWELAAGLLDRDRQWDLDGRSADNQLKRGTLNPRAKVIFSEGFLITGIDFSWDKVEYTGYWDEEKETVTSWADIERKTTGGYVFASVDLSEALKLSGGVRIESAETDNEHVRYMENQLFPELETNRGVIPNPDFKNPPDPDPALSYNGPVDKSGWAGELSLLWKAAEGVAVWAGWDRVYRYPSLDETASYQGYPLSDPLNEDLQPETGNNFEIGIKQTGKNWHLGLTGYFLLLNDEISFIETGSSTGDNVVRLNDNIGDSERRGLELDLLYQRDRYGANFMASITDVKLSNEGGELKMPLVPELEGNLSFWIKPVQDMRMQLHIKYQSSQLQGNDFEGSSRSIPSFVVANAFLYWDMREDCSFILGINNLFDRTYAMSAYSGGFYPAAGRQVYSTIKVRF